jgi:hypothetical protein
MPHRRSALNLRKRFELGSSGLIERRSTSIFKRQPALANPGAEYYQNASTRGQLHGHAVCAVSSCCATVRRCPEASKPFRLESGIRHELSEKFVTVICATVRQVAALQGALGGLIF